MKSEAGDNTIASLWGALLILTGMLTGCSTTESPQGQTNDGVLSQGMTRQQGPMLLDNPTQPGPADQRNAQLPTFPQKFDVQGPEADSFGFAVTQPGPVIVDVQATGAPVLVTLRAQGTQEILQEQGNRQVRVTYTVTPQDVQKGVLWVVQVRLAQPIPLPPGARASGTVMLQSPQANQAVAQAQAHALVTQRQATRQQPDLQSLVTMDAAFQEHQAKFEQGEQQKRSVADAQAQPVINQIRNQMSQRQVRPRGIEEPQPGGIPVQSEGNVGARELRFNQTIPTIQEQPLTEAPSQFDGRSPLSPPPTPAPTVTQLNISQGQPLQPVIITGAHFGTEQANVVFVIAANVGIQGRVEAWSDTLIVVDVPDQSGLLAYDGKVFVSTAGGNSNEVPFRFLPAMETRLISETTDMVLGPPSGSGIGDHVWHGPNDFWETFVGKKGNDILFPGSRLKNGWTVQTVFAQAHASGSEGIWVVDWRPATNTPFMNVRWWYDAFNEIRYSFGVYIVGPKGVPDGVAVP